MNLDFKVILEGEQIIEINIYEGNKCSKCKVDLFSSVYQNLSKMNKQNYRLSFQGKLLNLRILLIHYNIKNGDSLELIKTEEIILIEIEYKNMIKYGFHFDTNESLKDFKNNVGAKIKEDNFDICLYGMMLSDNKKIKDYDIINGMTVEVIPPILGG